MGALEDTQTQLEELYKLREAHRRRLATLQIKAATFGIDVPGHIVTEQQDIDRELVAVNQKIGLLSGALPAQQLRPVDPKSLIPQTIVPATINEHLLVISLELVHLGDEMRKNFQASYQSQKQDADGLWHAITDARDEIAVERDERRSWQEREHIDREEWQDAEQDTRRYGNSVLMRWIWVIAAALVLLFVIVVIIVVTAYVRDLIAQASR
jgi:hypothetical protein